MLNFHNFDDTQLKPNVNPIPGGGGGGGGLGSPFRFFLSYRQTPGVIALKLSGFVGTFIAHISAKKTIRVRSGHQTYLTRSIVEV